MYVYEIAPSNLYMATYVDTNNFYVIAYTNIGNKLCSNNLILCTYIHLEFGNQTTFILH